MYEKLEECPSCKYPKFSNFKIITDYSITEESFALVKCERCGLIFTNPRPDQENIGDFYKSENYISHTNKANNLTNLLYKQIRSITLRQKLNLIQSYTSHRNLIDFGSGAGTFLQYTLKNDYNSTGYEPDSKARLNSERLTKTKVFSKLSDLKKVKPVDVITAWHVLEHVHELKLTLKTLRKTLKDDGYLFVALPNPYSWDAKYYDKFWAGYDVPRHLYHFTRDSFTYLATKCKLSIKEIHPMKFDAYYVSLLSEKYKTGNTRFLKAFSAGLKSNQQAKSTGEYSSLIYVLTK